MTAQLAYGAVILTFVGAVHWGYAMRDEEIRWGRMTWSVTPSLVAWSRCCCAPDDRTFA